MTQKRWRLTPDKTYRFAVHIKLVGCPTDEFEVIKGRGNVHYVGQTIPITAQSILSKRQELWDRLGRAAEAVESLRHSGWHETDENGEWSRGLNPAAESESHFCLSQTTTARTAQADLLKAGGARAHGRDLIIEVLAPDQEGWELALTRRGLFAYADVDSVLAPFEERPPFAGKLLAFPERTKAPGRP